MVQMGLIKPISIHALRGEGDDALAGKDILGNISIHALRGEGDRKIQGCREFCNISIHALRGEGDLVLALEGVNLVISIHALRGEGDDDHDVKLEHVTEFQSTPSVGRATKYIVTDGPLDFDFNPRPPWGGRPECLETSVDELLFQSTPSVGRAT